MATNPLNKAVVLLSGGLDSATCLWQARTMGYNHIMALSFLYGQRHSIELQQAVSIAKAASVAEHVILNTDFNSIGGSALTDKNIEVPLGGSNLQNEKEIPITYVPARNLIFLSYACALAEARETTDIFIGINALDYSGYPDCRGDFIDAFTETAKLATRRGREGQPFKIQTPLLKLKKSEIIAHAKTLGVPLELTWSCYNPNATGDKVAPCGECDSCLLRARGFAEAGLIDPAINGVFES